MPAGAVTGLAAEARIARRAGLEAIAGGGDAAETVRKMRELAARGVRSLVSFGICAGLAPALAPGDIVLPRSVMAPGSPAMAVAAGWHARVANALAAAGVPVTAHGAVLGESEIAQSAPAKAALFAATGALALDMESHLVARAAGDLDIPFLVLRAVADAASRDLPPAALVGLDGDGRPQLRRVLGSLLAEPRQLGALIAVARELSRALAALGRAAPILAGVAPE
jgi:hopanoid-associated phosphorylase